MKYRYTIWTQGGTKIPLGIRDEEMKFKGGDIEPGMYQYLNCTIVEAIPKDYWPDELQNRDDEVVVFGDEEGRFDSTKKKNPLFKDFGGDWNIMGDVMVMEVLG